jgi:hypothetical protein
VIEEASAEQDLIQHVMRVNGVNPEERFLSCPIAALSKEWLVVISSGDDGDQGFTLEFIPRHRVAILV